MDKCAGSVVKEEDFQQRQVSQSDGGNAIKLKLKQRENYFSLTNFL